MYLTLVIELKRFLQKIFKKIFNTLVLLIVLFNM